MAFVGQSASWSHPGFDPHVDLRQLTKESGVEWDLLLCTDDSWLPHLPQGVERLPFPTALYSADYQTRRATFEPLVPLFDYIFLTNYDVVREVSAHHPQVHWCPPGCDPEVHFAVEGVQKEYEVGIVGSANPSYPDRMRRLRELSRRYKTNDFFQAYPREQIREIYSRSKIVVNLAPQGIPTFQFRILEAMACGSLLITDRSDSGPERLFRDREHFVLCDSHPAMIEAIDYYLVHEEERHRIARAGQELVVSQHRYQDRIQQILRVIGSSGWMRNAPARTQSAGRVAAHYAEAYAQRGVADPIFQLARQSKSLAHRLQMLWFMIKAAGRQVALWGIVRRLRLVLTGRGN